MRLRYLKSAMLLALFCALLFGHDASAGTVQILPIAGQAYGIDGNNIVGSTAISNVGFLYDGHTYTKIAFPGAIETVAYGISGKNIVGTYYDGSNHSFIYDGAIYKTYNGPPGAVNTGVAGISGNKIFGAYSDSLGKVHGFINDGGLWTTIDNPLGTKGTFVRGVSGNTVIGTYTNSQNVVRGFLYNGTTFTTLNDPLSAGGTIPYGISGTMIVGSIDGFTDNGFIYDGTTYSHPLYGTGAIFRGVSGNKIVGYRRDLTTGIDHPIIYTIPEPASMQLATSAAVGVALVAVRRARARRAGRHYAAR